MEKLSFSVKWAEKKYLALMSEYVFFLDNISSHQAGNQFSCRRSKKWNQFSCRGYAAGPS